jgi:anti-sigma regulatory factor (Ser/Thr protein kinase)
MVGVMVATRPIVSGARRAPPRKSAMCKSAPRRSPHVGNRIEAITVRDEACRMVRRAATGAMTILGTLTLPGSERSVAYARRFVRDMIGAGHPAVDDAELCTSELVTNAVAHTASGVGGRVSITVAAGADGLRIGVTDDGAQGRVPHVRREPLAEDGRGILIVTTVAAEWGVEAGENGTTTTWFRLRAVRDCGA